MSRDSPQDLPPELREAFEQDVNGDSAEDERPGPEDLWALLGSAKTPSSALPDASETWAEVRRHVEGDSESPGETRSSPGEADPEASPRVRRSSRSGTHRRVGWRVGTAVAVLLIVALGAWFWQRPIAVTAAPGTSVTHVLPDGSTVELNGGSRLTYPRSFSTVAVLEDQRRTVRIQGEAYFDVESAERPFVVRTRTAQVEVVGTAFAVRTDPGGAATHVALAEGTVRVRGRAASGSGTTLRPGETVRVGSEGRTSAPADTSIRRVTAWRRGGFAVTAQPLPVIAQALERQFGPSVRLSPAIPEAVTSSPLTLYYSAGVDIETILNDLAMARGLSYRSTASGYVLSPADASRLPRGANK
jgi:transmembrane sensor